MDVTVANGLYLKPETSLNCLWMRVGCFGGSVQLDVVRSLKLKSDLLLGSGLILNPIGFKPLCKRLSREDSSNMDEVVAEFDDGEVSVD